MRWFASWTEQFGGQTIQESSRTTVITTTCTKQRDIDMTSTYACIDRKNKRKEKMSNLVEFMRSLRVLCHSLWGI